MRCAATGRAAALGALALGVAGCGPTAEVGASQGPDQAPPGVLLSRVEVGDFRLVVEGRGRLEPLEQTVVTSPPRLMGVKISEAAEEGTRVTTGEVVLRLDVDRYKDRLENRERQLENAAFQLEVLRAQQERALATSTSQVDAKRLGLEASERKLKALLAGPRDEKVTSQRLAVQVSEASLRNSERKLAEEAALREKGFTSELAFLEARGAREKAARQRESASAELERLAGGPRPEERDKLAAERVMLGHETAEVEKSHAAKAEVQQLALEEKRLGVETRKGNVKRLKRRLDQAEVKASSSGVVLHSLYGNPGARAEVGSMLWSMMEVLRIVRLDRFQVVGRVGERDVDNVRVGAPVRVVVPALSGVELSGRVQRVGKFAVAQAGGDSEGPKEFEVWVTLDEVPEGVVARPNLSAQLEVEFATAAGFRVVREAAACEAPEGGPVTCQGEGRGGDTWTRPLAAADDEFLYFAGPAPGEWVRLVDQAGDHVGVGVHGDGAALSVDPSEVETAEAAPASERDPAAEPGGQP